MTIMILHPDRQIVSVNEDRVLASLPDWPKRTDDWMKLPPRMNAYLEDHFGLRDGLTHIYARLLHLWFGFGSESVLMGAHGRMFLRNDMALEQSAGTINRPTRLADTIGIIDQLSLALRQRHIAFLYTIAPNAATVEQADLPVWARNAGRETEYDQILNQLRARKIRTGDMRPTLRSASSQGSLYLHHDSHWNPLGEVVGFNFVADLASHPDWKLDPAQVVRPPTPQIGGDLARLLGINADVEATEPQAAPDRYPDVALSPVPNTALQITTDHPGLVVLILGDSFTEGFFRQLVARHARAVVWINEQACGFDWNWIERIRPDEVWWIPTERFAPCRLYPAHLPAPAPG